MITVDNSFVAYLDGVEIARNDVWQQPKSVQLSLIPGKTHLLAVMANNWGGAGGLIAEVSGGGTASGVSIRNSNLANALTALEDALKAFLALLR